MKTVLILLLTCLGGMSAPDAQSLFDSASMHHEGRDYPYRLLALKDRETALPLVVFLHGAGERGDNNTSQLRHFPERVISEPHFKNKPCYLLAMQCPRDDQWASYRTRRSDVGPPRPAMEALIKAIKQVVAENNIDTSRIYLTGHSMGGYGSWDLAARHPDWFAAMVPICGGGHTGTADRLTEIPIWAIHGTADSIVPEGETTRMINAIRKAGGRPGYTPLEGVGHASWPAAYGQQGVIEWMFAQKNPAPPDLERHVDDGSEDSPEP